jgi:hypothetical protein
VHYPEGESSSTFLFVLCEAADCGPDNVLQGRGTVNVYAVIDETRANDDQPTSSYRHVGRFQLPATLSWLDYSGLDVFGNTLVVVSQEHGEVWVGELGVRAGDRFEVVSEGHVFAFPRRKSGTVIYCNVEGVAVMLPHPPTQSSPPISAVVGMRWRERESVCM